MQSNTKTEDWDSPNQCLNDHDFSLAIHVHWLQNCVFLVAWPWPSSSSDQRASRIAWQWQVEIHPMQSKPQLSISKGKLFFQFQWISPYEAFFYQYASPRGAIPINNEARNSQIVFFHFDHRLSHSPAFHCLRGPLEKWNGIKFFMLISIPHSAIYRARPLSLEARFMPSIRT